MRDQAPDRHEPARPGPGDASTRQGAVETVLALHRSAGNRAVSALVARAPAPDPKAGAAGPRAVLSDIGTIPLLSVSFPPSQPGGARGSGRGKEQEPSVRELIVTSRVGDHTPALVKAAGDGTAMEVEIVIPGERAIHLTLKGAIVSGYQTSGGGPDAIETWTLNVQSLEHSVEGSAGGQPES